jgi:hypothetical protein
MNGSPIDPLKMESPPVDPIKPENRMAFNSVKTATIDLLTSRKKAMDPTGYLWNAVLAATGQPAQFK